CGLRIADCNCRPHDDDCNCRQHDDCNCRPLGGHMRTTLTISLTLMLAATTIMRGDEPAARWWSHVQALANDGMEGRNTGSAGHKRAADYVAAEFKKAGIEPAGIGGYIQPVKFNTRTIVEAQSSLALV